MCVFENVGNEMDCWGEVCLCSETLMRTFYCRRRQPFLALNKVSCSQIPVAKPGRSIAVPLPLPVVQINGVTSGWVSVSLSLFIYIFICIMIIGYIGIRCIVNINEYHLKLSIMYVHH